MDRTIEMDELEPNLLDLAETPLEDLLENANPTLRAVLQRIYRADEAGVRDNGRFNSFIAPDL